MREIQTYIIAAIYPLHPLEDCDCRAIRDHRVLFYFKIYEINIFQLRQPQGYILEAWGQKEFQ